MKDNLPRSRSRSSPPNRTCHRPTRKSTRFFRFDWKNTVFISGTKTRVWFLQPSSGRPQAHKGQPPSTCWIRSQMRNTRISFFWSLRHRNTCSTEKGGKGKLQRDIKMAMPLLCGSPSPNYKTAQALLLDSSPPIRSSSTSNFKSAFGGITPPAPRAP